MGFRHRSGRGVTRRLIVVVLATTIVGALPLIAGARTATCAGHTATIIGTSKADTLRGTMGDDVIVAYGGNDTIWGRGGNDIICGGRGSDTITGGTGNDVIRGDSGNDTISGGSGDDDIRGGGGNDTIRGTGGNDRLIGDAGDDALAGGGGEDFIDGGSGADSIDGQSGADELRGRSGNDLMIGGDGDDSFMGGDGDDTIDGGPGADVCDGGHGSDEASGCERLIATEIGQLPVPKIKPSSDAVALTFDDGPHPVYTPQVLAILAEYDVKATFFVLGWQARRYPELMADIVAAGHSVQNHTWFHARLTSWSNGSIANELTKAQDMIIETTGTTPRCYRPPYGATNSRVRGVAAGLDLTEVMWDTSAADYTRPPVANIVRRILTARGGSVILLHDAGGIRTNTVRALPYIIEGFQERDLTFETLCD